MFLLWEARPQCAQCKFKEYNCRGCGQQGHLKRLCPQVKGGKSSKPPKGPRIKTVETENDPDEEIATIRLVGHGNKPIQVEVKLDGQPLCMELDTGASRSLISEVTYRTLFKDRPLEKSKVRLRT